MKLTVVRLSVTCTRGAASEIYTETRVTDEFVKLTNNLIKVQQLSSGTCTLSPAKPGGCRIRVHDVFCTGKLRIKKYNYIPLKVPGNTDYYVRSGARSQCKNILHM